MFDSGYKFAYVGKSIISPKGHLCRHNYKFTTHKGRKYIVWVDEHELNTFIVKFFLQKDEKSKYKFNVLIGDNTAPRIINTSVGIMLNILSVNPTANFAFIGAETIKEEQNKISLTKRFRVYEILMKSKFSLQAFQHISVPERSAYLMFNKKNNELSQNDIIAMLVHNYPELDE